MDYKKHYNLLVISRKNRVKLESAYYERHHIIPVSMRGDNSKDNIVMLTAKEHYIAHLLLYKFTKNVAMTRAFVMISSRFKISSRIYEEARLLKNSSMPKKESHWCWGLKRPDLSERMKIKNPMFDESVRIKMSKTKLGVKQPAEGAKKSALSRLGKGNCNYKPIKSTNKITGETFVLGLKETAIRHGVDRELIHNRVNVISCNYRKLKEWIIEHDNT